MSYLGKISALVSVNTGDFGPKLNAAAKDVKSFASTVQRDITSAMRAADKAVQGVYTPLQRFERAMRAASSAKLSFVGLPGAIRTVDELQKKLYTLNNRQVSVVLKTSGMKSLDAFRDAIQGVSSKNIEILARVGGLEALKALREQMTGTKKYIEVEARTKEATDRLRVLEADLREARSQKAILIPVGVELDTSSLGKLEKEIEAKQAEIASLNKRQTRTTAGSKKFNDLEQQIGEADAALKVLDARRTATQAQSDIDTLSERVETARIEVYELQKLLAKSGGKDSATGLSLKQIDETLAALEKMGMTGQDVRKVIDALLQSDGTAFVGMMRQTASAVENVQKPIAEVNAKILGWGQGVQAGIMPALKAAQTAAESLGRSIAKAASLQGGGPSQETLRRYERAVALVNRLQEAASRTGRIDAAASSIGGVGDVRTRAVEEQLLRSKQIADSARGLSAGSLQANPGIIGSVGKMEATSQKVAESFSRLQSRIAKGLPTEKAESQLGRLLARLLKYQSDAERRVEFAIDAEAATRRVLDLRKYVKDVQQAATFKFVGDFENVAQVKAALDDALRTLDKFDEKQAAAGRFSRADFQAPFARLSAAADTGDFAAFKAEYAAFQKTVADGLEFNLKADKADGEIKALNAAFAALREKISSTTAGGISIPLKLGDSEQMKAAAGQLMAALGKAIDSAKQALPEGLGAGLAGSFERTTAAVEAFAQKARTVGVSVEDFRSLARAIAEAETSATRLADRLSSIKAGSEAARGAADIFSEARRRGPGDVVGQLSEVLKKGTDLTNQALALPGEFVRANLGTLDTAFKQYAKLSAEAEEGARKQANGETPQARAGGTKIVANRLPLLRAAQEVIEQTIKLFVDDTEAKKKTDDLAETFRSLREQARFNLTGIVGIEQVQSTVSELTGLIGKLRGLGGQGPAKALAFMPDMDKILNLARAAEGGDQAALVALRAEAENLRASLEGEIKVVINDKDAEDALKRLEDRTKRIREDLNFKITGQFQNGDQIERELASLLADIDKLESGGNAAVKAQVAPLVGNLRRGVNFYMPSIEAGMKPGASQAERDAAKQSIDALRQAADSIAGRKEGFEETDKKAKQVVQSLEDIAKIVFPNDPLQSLRESAQRARSEVEKVKDATKKAALEARLQSLSPQIEAATGPADQQRIAAELDKIGADAKVEVKLGLDNTKLNETRAKWQKTLTGKPQGVEDADQALVALFEKIGKLDAAQRNRFGNAIASLLLLRATAESVPADLQKLIDGLGKLDDKAGSLSKVGELEKKLKNLSDNVVTRDIKQQLAAAGAAGVDPSDALTRQVEGQASGGRDINDPIRQTDRLRQSFNTLRDQAAGLDSDLQLQLIPDFEKLNIEVNSLARAGAGALPQDIKRVGDLAEDAASKVKRLEAATNFRKKYGPAGLKDIVDAKQLRGYEAQLDLLASAISRTSGKAATEGAAAFEKLSRSIRRAINNDALGDPKTRERLEKAFDITAARIGGLEGSGTTSRELRGRVKRTGDVSRMGADKWSLALNQAAFAADDFMSSTGGMEFKLRAISNNITQMAFVLGGTTGLFVGLGVVMASTAAIGVMKWVNGGRTAEDQTKALNDSLAKQKSLVEDLAQAFNSLADVLGRNSFSAAGQKAADFDKQLTVVKKKQKEFRDEQAASIDPDVQRERAQQGALRNRLEKTTDIGQRIVLEQQIRDSQARERTAAEAAAARPPVTNAAAAAAIRRAGEQLFFSIPEGEDNTDVRGTAERRAGRAAAAATPMELRRSLIGQRAELQASPYASNQLVAEQIRQLTVLINSLEGPVERALDELTNQIVQSSRGAAANIESAQTDVAAAIERGVKGAAAFQAALDNSAKQLADAQKQLEEAQKIEGDPVRREREIKIAQGRVNDVRMRQDAISEQARVVRLSRTFGGERTTQALSQLQGNERFANEYAGLTAMVAAAVDKEMQARRDLESAIAGGDAAQQEMARSALEAAQAESDLAAAAAEAALALEETVSRIRKISTEALADSERIADDAQKRLNENPTVENAQARDAAERQLIADREKVTQANNAIDRRRSEIATDPQIVAIDEKMAALRDRRENLAAQARINGVEADPAEMEQIANQQAALAAERARVSQSLMSAEQQLSDALAQEAAVRRRLADEAEKQRQAELERGRARNEEAFGAGSQRADIDKAMGDAQKRLDEANAAYITAPSRETARRAMAAEAQFKQAQQRRQELQDNLDAAERRFNDDPAVMKEKKEIERRDRERADIIARAEGEGRALTGQEQARIDAIDEANREARAGVDEKRRVALRPEERVGEKFRMDQEILAREEAGRRLGLNERQRFREDAQQGIGADIRARAAVILRDSGQQDADRFMEAAINEQAKTIAPMLEEFRMERENALRQGPSRAALQVSDITTTQGQSELNRLLRGDDSAKDVNLAELNKQTGLLAELVDVVRNNPLPVLGP